MKTLEIGIAGYDQMKARTLAIARGEHTPTKGEPKVWFTSIESFAKLLSEHNRHLLELIAREQPGSLTELAEMAGRSKSNLSRTLKTMSQYGIVELQRGARGRLVPAGALRPSEARCLVDFNAVTQTTASEWDHLSLVSSEGSSIRPVIRISRSAIRPAPWTSAPGRRSLHTCGGTPGLRSPGGSRDRGATGPTG